MSYNPHRKVGVFYCATTSNSAAHAARDFVWTIPDKFSHPNSGRVELFFLEKWWFQKKM